MKIIDQLDLSEANFEGYQLANSDENKIELSKLNICIGENNSGKSRFMRAAMKINYSKSIEDKITINISELETIVYGIIHEITNYTEDVNLIHMPINHDLIDSITRDSRRFLLDYEVNGLRDYKKINDNWLSIYEHIYNIISTKKPKKGLGTFSSVLNKLSELKNKIEAQLNIFEWKIKYIYIPTLRNLNFIYNEDNYNAYTSSKAEDKFEKIILKKHFKNIRGNSYSKREIITGQKAYSFFKDIIHDDSEVREIKKDFEKYISKTFFSDNEVEITASKYGSLKIKIQKNEHEITNIGDGINAIICILYYLFYISKESTIICIEEPETHLHPGMQRILIEALMNKDYFPNFQYFITTHSNHFLDLAFEYPEDISIFHFQKKVVDNKEYFEINPTKSTDLDILNSLGVRNSSVFLSNCTIWVEGITDRLYIKKYLELYQEYLLLKDNTAPTYHEDLHYSFFEYAGTNLNHYNFADKDPKETIFAPSISNRLLLIADSDEAKGEEKIAKQQLHERLEKELKQNFYKQPVIEIENTLTVKTVTDTLISLNKGSKSVALKVDKNPTEISMRIGSFIHENYEGLSRKYCDTSKENQTISSTYKNEFCKNAITHMHSFDDLSPVAQKLAIKVYDFIKKHNSK